MKKFLSLVLALVMTMSLVTVSAGAKDFTDSTKIQYTEAVDVMSAVKVIDGYGKLRIMSHWAMHIDLNFRLGQFTRNYTQTTKRGLLTTNKG